MQLSCVTPLHSVVVLTALLCFQECSMDETPYVETLEPGEAGGSPDGAGGSKLPPVLANLMGSMSAGKSPQGPGGGGINVQEILTSIMVGASSSVLLCRPRPSPHPSPPPLPASLLWALPFSADEDCCSLGQPK